MVIARWVLLTAALEVAHVFELAVPAGFAVALVIEPADCDFPCAIGVTLFSRAWFAITLLGESTWAFEVILALTLGFFGLHGPPSIGTH